MAGERTAGRTRNAAADAVAAEVLEKQLAEAYDRGRTEALAEAAALVEPTGGTSESLYEKGYQDGYAQAQKDAAPTLTLFEAGKRLVDSMKATSAPADIHKALVALEGERGEQFVRSDIRLLVGTAERYQALAAQAKQPQMPARTVTQGDTEYAVAS